MNLDCLKWSDDSRVGQHLTDSMKEYSRTRTWTGTRTRDTDTVRARTRTRTETGTGTTTTTATTRAGTVASLFIVSVKRFHMFFFETAK